MQELVVCRVANPAFDGDGVVYPKVSKRGKSIGTLRSDESHTFMENVRHGRVVKDHHAAKVRLDLRQVFDIRAVAVRAVLAVVAAGEVLALSLEPVDYRVCVLLHRSREDYEVVPFAYFAQELVTVWALVDVVQDWHARTKADA